MKNNIGFTSTKVLINDEAGLLTALEAVLLNNSLHFGKKLFTMN